MRKKSQITRKTFVFTAVAGSFLIVAFVIATSLWSSKRTISATNEEVSEVSSFYLEAMADRRAKTITNLINNNFAQMEKALTFIEEEGGQYTGGSAQNDRKGKILDVSGSFCGGG